MRSMKATPYESYMRDGAGAPREALYIRLEHFEADAAPLWEHLGFELELPRVNASTREEDYRSYYGPKERAQVEKICAADISRFNYQFNN